MVIMRAPTVSASRRSGCVTLENDCGNNEDEVGCPTDCTGEHQVKCANGRCVPLEYRCDGDNDCGDTTDEQGCDTYQCSQNEIKCPNHVICFDTEFLCDGTKDCPDGWDEVRANCPTSTGSG
ncbi:low-density lipoprotein receptor-related protein 8-like [Pomacea canaliculata]|nr:low-density lipoprotein receptor-related protein 8-like [Pomacea canaliculata]XP_025102576.1 low-density lipoprotein receptor-related protein 8-like [Pomacea canaliculata]